MVCITNMKKIQKHIYFCMPMIPYIFEIKKIRFIGQWINTFVMRIFKIYSWGQLANCLELKSSRICMKGVPQYEY